MAALALGIYYGFFGAGVGILLVALLRVPSPLDSHIASVKSEARFVEFLMGMIAVAAHFLSGNIVNSLWIPWSIGCLIGGYFGGVALNKLGQLSPTIQKSVLRLSYTIAIVVSVWTVFEY